VTIHVSLVLLPVMTVTVLLVLKILEIKVKPNMVSTKALAYHHVQMDNIYQLMIQMKVHVLLVILLVQHVLIQQHRAVLLAQKVPI
jgi:uncharacterized membrane protein YjgN (DUF898 family)